MIADEIVQILKNAGVNLFATLPCEKIRSLHSLIPANFLQISLAKEEEGVGICAGAFIAGARPAMLVQSSGIGNMINALCSLTKTYELPLLILASWRGIYKEQIEAQVPLGRRLRRILRAIDINCSVIETPEDVHTIQDVVSKAYRENAVRAVLLNPKIWEDASAQVADDTPKTRVFKQHSRRRVVSLKPLLTRFEVLRIVAPYLDGKIVVCNLGAPCKELYQLKHQKSNFYMLGSMGSASPIGLGLALFTKKDVVVIDGDGSLLTNLGALSTIACKKPRNLCILAIDNGVHGSTGNQPTATSHGTDLELIAKGSGFDMTYKAANQSQILSTLQDLGKGPNFVHILAKAGNANVPNIPLTPIEIKQNVMKAVQE